MGAIPASIRPAWNPLPSEGPPPPEPGLWEQVTAAARVETDRVRNVEQMRKVQAYEALADALEPFGLSQEDLMTRTNVPLLGPMVSGELDYARIFAEAKRRGLKGPDGSALPDSPEEFEQRVLRRYGGRDADQALLARGQGVGAFAAQLGGAAAGSFADPVNIASLGFGGVRAGGLVAKLVTEGAANAAVEAAQAVTVNRQGYANLGEDYGIAQAAGDIGAAFVGGAVLRGAFEVPPKVLSAARGGFERAVANNWERLPQGLRQRWSGDLPQAGTPAHDLLVADTAEALAGGRSNLAEHEAAAIDVTRREAEIDVASPFAPSGAATALHPELLGEAMARIFATIPDAPAPAARTAPTTRSSLARGTAVRAPSPARGGGSLNGQILAGLRARGLSEPLARGIAAGIHAESASNPNALNPTSGAMALGQWLGPRKREIIRRYGNRPTLDQQLDFLVWELRGGDHGGARVLAQTEETAVLRAYIEHFMRPAKGAETSGDLERGMAALGRAGEPGGLREGGARVRDDISEADALQAEIDAIEARMDALRTAREGDEAGLLDELGERQDIPAPQAFEPPSPIDAPDLRVREAEAPAREPEPFDYRPALREIVADKTRSLNAIDDIAAELSISPEQVRAGFTRLAEDGEITVNRKTGNFLRKAQGRITTANTRRPRTLVEFLAERGGLNDFGGDLRAIGLTAKDRRFGRKVIRATERPTLGTGAITGEGDYGLDSAFQAAREAGYFPEHQGRTEASYDDLLDGPALLLEAISDELGGRPRYSEGDFGRLRDHGLQGATERDYGGYSGEAPSAQSGADEFVQAYEAALDEMGIGPGLLPLIDELPADVAEDVLNRAELLWRTGDNPHAALENALTIEYEATSRMAAEESGNELHAPEIDDPREYDPEFLRWVYGAGDGEAGGGPASFGQDPRAGAGTGESDAGDRGPALADLTSEERSAFLDPDSSATRAQTDSLTHDARVLLDTEEAIDPAIAERTRQELALRAEAPLRGESRTGQAQDGEHSFDPANPTLFDAADQPAFLLDPEGKPVNLAELMNEIELSEAELKTIRDCM